MVRANVQEWTRVMVHGAVGRGYAVHVVQPNIASAFIEPLYKLSLCAFPTASLSLSLTHGTAHVPSSSPKHRKARRKNPTSPIPSMEKKNPNPIVDPKAADSILDAVPGTDNATGA